MYLVRLYIPLLAAEQFSDIKEELVARFGGLTAFTRAPAEGLWKPDQSAAQRDNIVVIEVMSDSFDEIWWRSYRARLERQLKQDKLLATVQDVTPI